MANETETTSHGEKIHWMPWSEEAFARARAEDKLVLLDVGAGWCHWCHVMDRTTYLDDRVAKLVNDRFVPVRVDRDARPDVDHRYQSAPTLIESHGGGWPLTVFLLPTGEPLFRATYLPPDDQRGMTGFIRLADRLLAVYGDRRAEVENVAEKLRISLDTMRPQDFSGTISHDLQAEAFENLSHAHDEQWGGFYGTPGQPKFPSPGAYEFLLAYGRRADSRRAVEMVEMTLGRMIEGGVHDQLAGGFHRYSVDREWRVPHFEKLLYDNAELLVSCVHTWQTTRKARFREAAEGVLRFVGDVLTDREDGGFYGSQDADVGLDDDGDYFTWSIEELQQCLGGPQLEAFLLRYGVEETGDMRHDPSKNVLRRAMTIDEVAERMHIGAEEARRLVSEAGERVLAERARRPTPRVDKTLYTSWNGMMIRAMAEAAQALDWPEALESARRAADRLLRPVSEGGAWSGYGALAHVAGHATPMGLLEDQAWMALGLVELFEATGEHRYLAAARAAVAWADRYLWDESGGGYFDRLVEPEVGGVLGMRVRPAEDNPSSSPNAVIAMAMQKLSVVCDGLATGPDVGHSCEEYAARARRVVETFAELIPRLGPQGGSMSLVAEVELAGATRIVVAGSGEAARALVRVAAEEYVPGKVLLAIDPEQEGGRELLRRLNCPARERATAYVCPKRECLRPVREAGKLVEMLKGL